ncbi:MAG: glycosyltransferase family 1 protein, partial [Micavibrio aeruginosavorus]
PGYAEIRLTLFPAARLRHMIAAFEPDLLHIATEGPLGLAARRHAVDKGLRFTSCYHTHFPDYAAARAARYIPSLYAPVQTMAIRFVRWFHAPSSCVFTATNSLTKTLLGWNFKSPLKMMTRGINHALFHPGEKTLFQEMKHPVALYVGRIAIEKNLDDFLSMPFDGTKVLVGGGPDLEDLKKKYPDAIFTGPKTGTDLADHYRSADVFVFPSKTDTFGMVLVEALACGLPVAAYPVTGPIDIITDDFLGALDNDLAAATSKALQHGTAAQRSRHAMENYSWRIATHQFLETDPT